MGSQSTTAGRSGNGSLPTFAEIGTPSPLRCALMMRTKPNFNSCQQCAIFDEDVLVHWYRFYMTGMDNPPALPWISSRWESSGAFQPLRLGLLLRPRATLGSTSDCRVSFNPPVSRWGSQVGPRWRIINRRTEPIPHLWTVTIFQ